MAGRGAGADQRNHEKNIYYFPSRDYKGRIYYIPMKIRPLNYGFSLFFRIKQMCRITYSPLFNTLSLSEEAVCVSPPLAPRICCIESWQWLGGLPSSEPTREERTDSCSAREDSIGLRSHESQAGAGRGGWTRTLPRFPEMLEIVYPSVELETCLWNVGTSWQPCQIFEKNKKETLDEKKILIENYKTDYLKS